MYAESIADALCNLRALLASARRAPRGTQESLCEAVERLRRRHPQLSIVTRGCERRVPAKLDELAGHFLAEGLRNAAKHARPSEVEVRAETTEATLVIEIFNDGVRGERASGGLGLRLLTLHALEHGAIAVFGMSDKATWRARLVAPLGGA